MKPIQKKRAQLSRRKLRIRGSVFGTAQRPRLSVFRSLNQIYAQVIDDMAGRTLCAASTRSKDLAGAVKKTGNKDAAKAVAASTDEAGFKAAAQKLGQACGGCHEKYRRPKG